MALPCPVSPQTGDRGGVQLCGRINDTAMEQTVLSRAPVALAPPNPWRPINEPAHLRQGGATLTQRAGPLTRPAHLLPHDRPPCDQIADARLNDRRADPPAPTEGLGNTARTSRRDCNGKWP